MDKKIVLQALDIIKTIAVVAKQLSKQEDLDSNAMICSVAIIENYVGLLKGYIRLDVVMDKANKQISNLSQENKE